MTHYHYVIILTGLGQQDSTWLDFTWGPWWFKNMMVHRVGDQI